MSDALPEIGLTTPFDNMTIANHLLDSDMRSHMVDHVAENYRDQMADIADRALKAHPQDALLYLGDLCSIFCAEIVRLRTMMDITNGMVTIHGLEIDALGKKVDNDDG